MQRFAPASITPLLSVLKTNCHYVQGYVDAARMLEQESGTAPGVELNTITDRMEIRKAVQSGQVEEAIDKVNDLNPEVGWQKGSASSCAMVL